MTPDEIREHVIVDAWGDWACDLNTAIREATEQMMRYLGVEFEEERVANLAYEAARQISDELHADFCEGKARAVDPVNERPWFCFWTPELIVLDSGESSPDDREVAEVAAG